MSELLKSFKKLKEHYDVEFKENRSTRHATEEEAGFAWITALANAPITKEAKSQIAMQSGYILAELIQEVDAAKKGFN